MPIHDDKTAMDIDSSNDQVYFESDGPEACRPSVVILMEEFEDESAPGKVQRCWVEEFPTEKHARAHYGPGPTKFQSIQDDQILQGAEILGPFESEEEWELAKWLIKNMGHNQTDVFLKLPIVSQWLLGDGENTYIG